MKILCTICARKNSKGLKNKNIKRLKGIPLISRTLLQAKKSKLFEDIVVSTDSKKIQFISKKLGFNSQSSSKMIAFSILFHISLINCLDEDIPEQLINADGISVIDDIDNVQRCVLPLPDGPIKSNAGA